MICRKCGVSVGYGSVVYLWVRKCGVSVGYGSGMLGGGTRLVTHNLCTTLYCMCEITSGYNRGAVTEADTIGKL